MAHCPFLEVYFGLDYTKYPAHEIRSRADGRVTSSQKNPPEIASIQNLSFDGPAGPVRLRVYHPGGGILPVVVFFHGGGFVLGNLDTHDTLCRLIALRSRAVVVSVDYRLAPEHPFPAAPEDAFAAVNWIARNAPALQADPARIAVAGDSAGANLSAVVTQLARDRGGPAIRRQILIYPAVNMAALDTPSHKAFADGYFLTSQKMIWFRKQYLPDERDWTSPLASPLLAKDLSRLPPALVITAQIDPVRDEGEAYAQRLQASGVAARVLRKDGVIHAFMTFLFLDQTQEALNAIAEELKQGLQ